jgi:hypothetical protein
VVVVVVMVVVIVVMVVVIVVVMVVVLVVVAIVVLHTTNRWMNFDKVSPLVSPCSRSNGEYSFGIWSGIPTANTPNNKEQRQRVTCCPHKHTKTKNINTSIQR